MSVSEILVVKKLFDLLYKKVQISILLNILSEEIQHGS